MCEGQRRLGLLIPGIDRAYVCISVRLIKGRERERERGVDEGCWDLKGLVDLGARDYVAV